MWGKTRKRCGVLAVVSSLLILLCAACTSLDGVAGGDTDAGFPDGSAADAIEGDASNIVDASTTDGIVDGDAESTDALCGGYANALCSRLSVCRPAFVQQSYGGPLKCVDRLKDGCLVGTRAPGTTFVPKLRDCATKIGNASCAEIASGGLPTTCLSPGTLADGATCITDLQCTGLLCGLRASNGCGVCQTRSGVDGSCSPGCAAGLQCASTGKCAVSKGLNEPCDVVPCSLDLQCVSQRCVPFRTLNESCGGTNDGACDGTKGYFCDSASSVCVTQPTVAAGMSCMTSIPPICTGGICAPGPGGPPPICTAWAQLGEACGGGPPPRICATPFQCVAGQCVLPDMKLCN